jgi:excisionase family DNA binding protein
MRCPAERRDGIAFKSRICLVMAMKSSKKIISAESLPKVLTVREVSEYLRIHPTTVYRLLRSRQIPGFRVGGEWRFGSEIIDRWRSGQEQATASAGRATRVKAPDRAGLH